VVNPEPPRQRAVALLLRLEKLNFVADNFDFFLLFPLFPHRAVLKIFCWPAYFYSAGRHRAFCPKAQLHTKPVSDPLCNAAIASDRRECRPGTSASPA
ncbi:hypothetical protein, partial [Pantoea piersonii]|uniref:hypothetical protein n=1 Tax=Pantoea piersonii TaxID=2364647 RepID=UPI00289F788A